MTRSGWSKLLLAVVGVVVCAGCSPSPAVGGINVTVELKNGITAKCVRVTATDGLRTVESEAMVLKGMGLLKVGIIPTEGLTNPVTVQALGYRDTECVGRNEESSATIEDVVFANPATKVTLILGPANAQNDGGSDAGVDAGTTDAGVDAGTDAGTDAGVDAGIDAGIDTDNDGSPDDLDCADMDPTVRPGIAEVCDDGKDNNCDNQSDCADVTECPAATPCGSGNACVNMVCMGTAENCTDGIDNNGVNGADCFDPLCLGMSCTDANACTTGDRCVVDGGCEKTMDVMCNTPPAAQCFMSMGTCRVDAGNCEYTPIGGSCDDGLACTGLGTCNITNGACMPGTTSPCPIVGACFLQGACTEPSGTCSTPPVPAGQGTCSDNNNCTISDSCAGDGGCAGTPVVCTGTQCQNVVPNVCDTNGNCTFMPLTGQTCDAGSGMGAATCNSSGMCNVTQTALFPYTQSNFTDANVAPGSTAVDLNNCTATFNTTAGTSNNACFSTVPVTITQGGQQTLLFVFSTFRIRNNSTLTFTGNKPVIFAVLGAAQIEGDFVMNNNAVIPAGCDAGNGFTSRGGGGGGGFGTAGGLGGHGAAGTGRGTAGTDDGNATLIPLRGGCPGGLGANNTGATDAAGGLGGGSLQISAAGTLSISGIIAAPGRGGTGANLIDNGGGGGGSGGGVLLEGNSVVFSGGGFHVTTNGGGGGEGSQGQLGDDGSAGVLVDGNGGAGGADGSGNGGNGGRGGGSAAALANGQNSLGGTGGGGGGGGSVGRIRINSATSCTMAGSFSPTATSNGATNCP